jgi:hypothetical protein
MEGRHKQRDITLRMMQDRVLRGLDSLSPLRVGETDKYRVPLWEDDHGYTLFVGDNLTRTFSKEQDKEHPLELPAEVKTQMTFIKTAKAYEENAVRLLTEPSLARVFINSFPDSYEEIGWRIEENIFVVVLSKKTLEGLRGVPFATS